MSPVSQSNRHAGRALAVAIVGVGAAIALALGVSVLANRGSIDVRLGDDQFDAGVVTKLIKSIEREDQERGGGPLIFSDVALGDRPIFVNHLGANPRRGWFAFQALCDDKSPITWDADRERFTGCGTTYPPDGKGLRQYPADVRDGHLFVDLNADG